MLIRVGGVSNIEYVWVHIIYARLDIEKTKKEEGTLCYMIFTKPVMLLVHLT